MPKLRLRRRGIHNANGYLLDQFLRDGTNRRTENTAAGAKSCPLTLEVTDAVTQVWGADTWVSAFRRAGSSTTCTIQSTGDFQPCAA